jgi:O-antigen/teichoic acid export membrane protein
LVDQKKLMNDLLKGIAKAGVGSGVNLAISLARNKVLSVNLGPQGMGTLSLLQQLVATATPIATLGGDTPIVQGLASREGSQKAAFFSSALFAMTIAWTLCSAALLIGPLLGGAEFALADVPGNRAIVLMLLILPVLGTAVSSVLTSCLAALGAVGSLQKSQMLGNCAGLLAAMPLGGLWALGRTEWLPIYMLIAPIFCIIGSIFYMTRLESALQLFAYVNRSAINAEHIRSFLRFGGVTIITGFVTTGTWLYIRRFVADEFGLRELGFLAATINLSGLALSVFGTTLSSFYLPRFAAASAPERKRLLKVMLLIVSAAAGIVLAILQTAPDFIVRTLFSKEFLPIVPLLKWWALGDFFRSISYVFAIPMFAGAHLRLLFFTELIFSALLIGGTYTLSKIGQDISKLGILYTAIYFLYLTVTAFSSKRSWCHCYKKLKTSQVEGS